jgi:acyl-CoA synthetase (AMP-forming)/AMP-acid ligase II
MRLPERIARVLELEPESPAIEYEGRWYPWRFLASSAKQLDAALSAAGVGEGEGIGLMATNRPTTVAAMAGLVMSRRPVIFLNPQQPPAQLGAELATLRPRALVADGLLWPAGPATDALHAFGAIGLAIDGQGGEVRRIPGLDKPGSGPFRPADPGVALIQTTSGTTGPPKRTMRKLAQLEESLAIAHPKSKNEDASNLRVKRSPTLAFKSMAHSGGANTVLIALYEARPISLHDRFSVPAFVAALERHRPRVTSLVPAMLRMVWDADVPREALGTLMAIRVGTAPLDPGFQQRFEEKYGVPLLIDYGGTEIGGVTTWSLDDHRQYGAAKRGSVGRLKRSISVRVVDEESGAEKARGEVGLLEVRNPQLGAGWVRTTDLVSIDADDFLYVHGRADGAINRGGFKILPETVSQALRQHELVGDAALVGIPDERLGQVPVGFVEPRLNGRLPDPAALIAYLREQLPPYQVPVAIHVLASLPRTPSLKVNLAALRELAANPPAH